MAGSIQNPSVCKAFENARTAKRKLQIAKDAFDQGAIGRVALIAMLAKVKAIETAEGAAWLPWEDALIRAGIHHGDTFQTIAEKLPSRTRNACIGRARRLGLSAPDLGRRVAKRMREQGFTPQKFNHGEYPHA